MHDPSLSQSRPRLGCFCLTNAQPVTATGKVSQDGVFLLDLLARYDLSANVSLGVNATYVLDKTYFRNVGFFNSGWYGTPRRVLGNLRWSF